MCDCVRACSTGKVHCQFQTHSEATRITLKRLNTTDQGLRPFKYIRSFLTPSSGHKKSDTNLRTQALAKHLPSDTVSYTGRLEFLSPKLLLIPQIFRNYVVSSLITSSYFVRLLLTSSAYANAFKVKVSRSNC